MNENLRHALLRARLTDEDIAARLEVDPKTVRRWLEGRTPYLRHRWALATMLDLDEADLWPQARPTPSRPEEVRAIYPHRDVVPRELWQELFRSAHADIGILAHSGLFLAQDANVQAALRERTQAGVQLRICLRDPDLLESRYLAASIRGALDRYRQLRDSGDVEIRLHRATLINSIYRADEELLVTQHAFGIPSQRAPVLHLHRTDSNDMVSTYLESFYRIWTEASLMLHIP